MQSLIYCDLYYNFIYSDVLPFGEPFVFIMDDIYYKKNAKMHKESVILVVSKTLKFYELTYENPTFILESFDKAFLFSKRFEKKVVCLLKKDLNFNSIETFVYNRSNKTIVPGKFGNINHLENYILSNVSKGQEIWKKQSQTKPTGIFSYFS